MPQFFGLFALQILGACTEVISIGLIIPFLAALGNADAILGEPRIQPYLHTLNIDSPSRLIAAGAILFASAVLLVNCLRLFTLWVQGRLAAAVGNDLSVAVFRQALYQPFEFHASVNSSTLISNLINDMRTTIGSLYSALLFLTHSLVATFIIAAMIVYNPTVAAVMAAITGGFYILVSWFAKRYLIRNGELISNLHMDIVKLQQEGIGGIRDVILDSSQDFFCKLYRQYDRPMRIASADNRFIMAAPRYILEAIGVAVLCGVAFVLAQEEQRLNEILPLLGGLALAAARLMPAMQQCYASVSGIHGSQASIRRIAKAISRQADPVSLRQKQGTLQLRHELKLENISFHYRREDSLELLPWALKQIDFTLAANSIVAFVGATGSGKSTLADIVLGLLRPVSGRIMIDGVELDDKHLAFWRSSVAHVPQNIYLSDASIAENIAFGVPLEQVDMDRVHEVARAACVAEFVEVRPNGYQEMIGERGVRLSGGQRQRIGIARALYKGATLIVFDEATSALDSEMEREVMRSIENAGKASTVIVIAHRLSTIQNADTIYEMRNGEIVARGSYGELISESTSFREMVRDPGSKVIDRIPAAATIGRE